MGAATQPSSWNRIPGYNTTNNAYQPPRQLGVYMQNTPNGVIVGQITPGSVAERAGLKVGDLIVSVAGIQGGIVNGRVVDVMYVINTNLDYFGRVSALVFDGSTRVAKSLVFDFSTNTTAITAVNGQVALEGGFPAYRSGTIKVDLVNLTRPYLTASGGNTYVQVNGTGPFAFSIPYDVRLNSQADQYRLVATYFDSNRQMISSSSLDIGVLNPAVPNSYSLRLLATPASAPYSSAYGVYSPNPNMINDAFRQYLGREPSISESQAWTQQISTMNLSEKDVK
ncbi:MAG: PDZ domain-containing protein, partial [Pirellulaceae bacterium]